MKISLKEKLFLKKKIVLNQKEFNELRIKQAQLMNKDKKLIKDAINILTRADNYMFIHQSNFLGQPSLNLSQDLFLFQEIIWKSKPDVVLEIGMAWGGTSLYLANILSLVTNGKVICIDKFVPEHVKRNIQKHKKLSKNIKIFQGISTDKKIINKIKTIIRKKKVMVILDSDHTEENVLKELNIYSKFLKKNDYLIVCDTFLNFTGKIENERPRMWNNKKNPHTALKKFLKSNSDFKIDQEINNKLLLSCNYNGYIKKEK